MTAMGKDRDVFGPRVESALRARGWTQGQLAHFSGVGQSHISQIIKGTTRPRIDIAASLARALGVSLDWLAGLPPQPGVETLTPEERELVEAFAKLDAAHRQLALDIVKGFAEMQ